MVGSVLLQSRFGHLLGVGLGWRPQEPKQRPSADATGPFCFGCHVAQDRIRTDDTLIKSNLKRLDWIGLDVCVIGI
jgi:hypothetical protein